MKLVHATKMRVATLAGHVVVFAPGVPRDVPQAAVRDCMAKGARPYTEPGEPEPVIPAIADQVSAESDHSRLVKLFKEVIDRSAKEEFRQDGQPKSAVVLKYFGRNINDEERTAAWAEATASVPKAD